MAQSAEYSSRLSIDQELLRLTFCGIIIASFFASIAAANNLRTLLGPSGTNIGSTVLGLSAGFAFAYLVSVASALKFQSPRQVDRFPLSIKASQFFYDTSINIFGVYVLVLLVEWVDFHFLHLPNTVFVWPVYLILFSIMYFLARGVWALAQKGIEWQYDYMNHRDERIDKLKKGRKRD